MQMECPDTTLSLLWDFWSLYINFVVILIILTFTQLIEANSFHILLEGIISQLGVSMPSWDDRNGW